MNITARILIVIAGLATQAGCYNAEQSAENEVKKRGFVYCETGDIDYFNPQLSKKNNVLEAISAQIYDRLFVADTKSQKPVKNIVDSWQINRAGTVYTFTLKKGVKFHSTPWFTPTRDLNAQDVAFSFKRILNPKHPYHNINTQFYPWFDDINFATVVKSVRAVTPQKIEFTLYKANSRFLSFLSSPYAVILSEEYAQSLTKLNKKEQIDTQPIGTGPFKLSQYQKGEYIRLKRHDDYWHNSAKMEQVVFDISRRGTGSLAKLLQQECDVMLNPIPSQLSVVSKNSDITLHSQTTANISYLVINFNNLILKKAPVRRALSLAIDRESLIDSVYYDSGIAAKSLLSPASWAYNKAFLSSISDYDTNEAKRLLREAGITKKLDLVMWVPLGNSTYNPSPKKTAEIIQNNFDKIGVNLTLISDDILAKEDLSDDIDLILTGWNTRSPDPHAIFNPLVSCYSEKPFNIGTWCDEEFDKQLESVKKIVQPRHRVAIYHYLQRRLHQEMPLIPLAHGIKYQANQKSLIGFNISPFSTYPFNNVTRATETFTKEHSTQPIEGQH